MWKKNNQITAPTVKTNLKRLHLDKKQYSPALPQIHLKNQAPSQEMQKQEKSSLRSSNSKKKFSLYQKHRTVVPYLVKGTQGGNSYRSLEKMESQSDIVIKQRPLRSRKQSQSRIRIMSKNIAVQKQRKSQLHLQQQKYSNQNSSQNYIIQDRKKQKKLSLNQGYDWYQTSHNTIFEDTQPNSLQQSKIQPKQFQNVAVQTDLQMNTQTFKDFIKFKITQKQKYQKLQEIFNFVDHISHKQIPNFNQRYQKIKQVCQNPLQTLRQQEIKNIIESVELNQTRFFNFIDSLVTKITKVKKNQISQNISQVHHVKQQLHQLKKQINKCFQLKENTSVNKSIEPFTPKNQITPKKSGRLQKSFMKINSYQPLNRNFLSLDIHQKFSNITKYLTQFQNKIKGDQQEIKVKLVESQQQFKQLFQTWKFNMQEKNHAIQVCVGDILKLPEMSLSIFGMNREDDNKEERDILRKIGVFLDSIPQFDEFYSKSEKKKHEDFCFKEVLEFKCLNCAYLKSKMRFIYSKNKELESVVKILNYLVRSNKQEKS